ncbi:D-alanine--D-alanine ligase family protein [Vagococcus acidifermentans]|uniref:D-alanine--D-alanine ligase n=1 Tax=Vagococcus acidifermentans TaxID=564710 RepID=A0A430AS71_9ENTE|nr:D-alanine--D-alanine ligase [Vagococcus acidifermentans]RSU10907.1 hypothetical protein CBF27_09435 [Vagococcus acidifermentans]
MKIVVLGGGYSTEREVSLVTSQGICRALNANGHQAVLIDMALGLDTFSSFASVYDAQKEMTTTYTIEASVGESVLDEQSSVFGPHVLKICQLADIVFIGLHGETGEDGKVQATFDTLGIRYTGSGFLASALAMDKHLSKILMAHHGIRTPAYHTIQSVSQFDDLLPHLALPCVVKPASGGSSIGVVIAQTVEECRQGVEAALFLDSTVIIEEFVDGREFSCGFLGDQILPAVEIIPKQGFYDYRNKYQPGATEEVSPPDISDELHHTIQDMTRQVKELLHLEVYGRVDFLVDQDERVYCIEANTLPGMTPTSLLPVEAQAVGISYNDLCEKIMQESLK